jgi:uncharacterized membrane protein
MPSRRTLAQSLCLAITLLLAASNLHAAGVSFNRTLLGDNAGGWSEVVDGGLNNLGHGAVYGPSATVGGHRPFFWSPEGGLSEIPAADPNFEGWPVRINEADEVIGNFSTQYPAYRSRGFVWSAATGTRELFANPAWSSHALSINNFGTVGFVTGEDPYMFWQSPRPYLWNPDNTFVPLADLLGEPFGWPWAINDAGQVVGDSFSARPTGNQVPPGHAFRYTPGVGVERLGDRLGTPYGNAHGINRSGDAIVTLQYIPLDSPTGGDTKAIFWGADGSTVEVAPPGGNQGEARYINDRGEVCGRYVVQIANGNYVTRAFYWSRESGPIDIGASFPFESDADGMNALGHVVGFYLPVENDWSSLRGYFWSRETGAIDLGPGRAWAINDSDLLGGYANFADGTNQAAVWTRVAGTPDPPPTCSVGWLRARVEALAKAGTLKKGAAASLDAKLRAAAALQAKGQGRAASNMLGAFENEVRALVKTRRLPAAEGEALTSCAGSLCTPTPRGGGPDEGKKREGHDRGR